MRSNETAPKTPRARMSSSRGRSPDSVDMLRIKAKQALVRFPAFYRACRFADYLLGRLPQLVVAAIRITKNAVYRLVSHSDYQRWTNSQNLEVWWESRTRYMASLIPGSSHVIEFGAGRRHLERLLEKSCVYTPSDLVNRGDGTVILDLNRRNLPDLSHLAVDVAVFAGVLEYLADVQSVVAWLSTQVSLCVASYESRNPSNNVRFRLRVWLRRLYYGYMNSYTEEEVIQIFESCGFKCTRRETWTNQRIFVFENNVFPSRHN
jgi:hypothetical protein